MHKPLKTLHIIAVCAFVGSIPGHILLGAVAAAAEPASAVIWYQAKHLLTETLTGTAILAALATGAATLASRRHLLGARWMQAKLLLIVLIAANGIFVLTPISAQLALLAGQAADGVATTAAQAALRSRENLAGAANLALLALVIGLAVLRPGRAGAAPADLPGRRS